MKTLTVLFCSCTLATLLSCSSASEPPKTAHTLAMPTTVKNKLYHSGGVHVESELCPKSPFDTITPIYDKANADKTGLTMSIEGLEHYIHQQEITTIEALLSAFPTYFRTQFSLIEHTQSPGQSNLQHPRIVLFGSDGRFLLNIGTKPDDPTYNKLDVAQLNTRTGHWEFSVFDFTKPTPKLTRNDTSCNECHGRRDARPIWGTFQQWTGVFGDSIIDGPRPEALDHTHAFKMNDIILGEGGSERFDFLKWKPTPLRRGGVRMLANHDFGPELLLSNVAMGSASALGAYLRLSQAQPHRYKASRASLLLAYLKTRSQDTRRFIKIVHTNESMNYAKEKNQQISDTLKRQNYQAPTLDKQLSSLGLNPAEAFSLATLHDTQTPDPSWSTAHGDLYDMLMLQILNELRNDNPAIERLLENTGLNQPIFQCPSTARNIADLVDFKMLHLFYLSGQARYRAHWIYYPKDVDDIYDQVFLPIAHQLIPILHSDKT